MAEYLVVIEIIAVSGGMTGVAGDGDGWLVLGGW